MSEYYPKKCPCCGNYRKDVERRHMSTAYIEEERNYMTSCLECFEESEEYWAAMWDEYNSGRL